MGDLVGECLDAVLVGEGPLSAAVIYAANGRKGWFADIGVLSLSPWKLLRFRRDADELFDTLVGYPPLSQSAARC